MRITFNGSEGFGRHSQRSPESSQKTVLGWLVRGPEPQHSITVTNLRKGYSKDLEYNNMYTRIISVHLCWCVLQCKNTLSLLWTVFHIIAHVQRRICDITKCTWDKSNHFYHISRLNMYQTGKLQIEKKVILMYVQKLNMYSITNVLLTTSLLIEFSLLIW